MGKIKNHFKLCFHNRIINNNLNLYFDDEKFPFDIKTKMFDNIKRDCVMVKARGSIKRQKKKKTILKICIISQVIKNIIVLIQHQKKDSNYTEYNYDEVSNKGDNIRTN